MTAQEPVGSLGQEAVRLLDALQEWTRRHADGSPHGSDPHGPDPHGSDRHGSDRHGSDRHGSDRHGSDRHGSDRHGSDPHGSDPHGSDPHGSDADAVDDGCPANSRAAECTFCPFCQLLAALRGSHPEAVEHLASAGASVAAALRELLGADAEDRPRQPRNGLEHIDIG